MEFPGVGVVPYDRPSESLKPYFRKKFKQYFMIWPKDENGLIQREVFKGEVEEKIKMFPKDEREEAGKKRMKMWDYWLFHGKNSVCEREWVNEWVENRAFAPLEERKRMMEEMKENWNVIFDGLDVNRNGVVEWDEWKSCISKRLIPVDFVRNHFDVIDANKDGVISLDESGFAILSFHFHDGPDGPFESMFGFGVPSLNSL